MAPQPLPAIPFHFLHLRRLPPSLGIPHKWQNKIKGNYTLTDLTPTRLRTSKYYAVTWEKCEIFASKYPLGCDIWKDLDRLCSERVCCFCLSFWTEMRTYLNKLFFFFPAPQLDLFVARVMFLMITRKSIKPIRQGMSHTSEHSVRCEAGVLYFIVLSWTMAQVRILAKCIL